MNSGYRCEELNSLIGGSPRSQHCRGEAADLRVAPRFLERRRKRCNQLLRDFEGRTGWRPETPPTATFYLFAAAAIHLEELDVDQLIHEFGDRLGAPAWLHISHSGRSRRLLTAVGPLTDREYRHYGDLRALAEALG